MVWPIPPLQTTRANDTPQFDKHPADHNAIADALNELGNRGPWLMKSLLSRTSYTSGDLANGTYVPVQVATVAVRAGRTYLVAGGVTGIYTVGTTGAGMLVRLSYTGNYTITQHELTFGGPNISQRCELLSTFVPGITGNVTIQLDVSRTWWSANAPKWSSGNGAPAYLAIIDLGLTPP